MAPVGLRLTQTDGENFQFYGNKVVLIIILYKIVLIFITVTLFQSTMLLSIDLF